MTAPSKRAARVQLSLVAVALVLLSAVVVGLALNQAWLVFLPVFIFLVAMWFLIGFGVTKIPSKRHTGYDYSLMAHWERVALRTDPLPRKQADSGDSSGID